MTVAPIQSNSATKKKNPLSAADRKNIKVSPETLIELPPLSLRLEVEDS